MDKIELEELIINADNAGDSESVEFLLGELDRLKSTPEKEEKSTWDSIKGGLASAPINAYLGGKQLINGGLSDIDKSILMQNREAEKDAPVSSILSNVATMAIPATGLVKAGGYAGKLGTALANPANMAQATAGGAVYGGIQPTMEDESRLLNVGVGGVGGTLGYGVGKLAQKVVRPIATSVVRPQDTVDSLGMNIPKGSNVRQGLSEIASREGIPLSAADKTGSKVLQNINAAMANIPATAGRVAEEQALKQAAFNKAVLKKVGIDADRATPDVLNAQYSSLGNKFEELSSGRQVKLGDKLLNTLVDIDSAQAEVRGILNTSKIDKLVNGVLDKMEKGSISGEAAQSIRSELTKEVKSTASQGNHRLSDALKTLRNGIDESIKEGLSPSEKKLWNIIKRQYANLKTVENVMNRPSVGMVEGDISGAGLLSALKQSNKGQPISRGRGDLNELGRIGQMFIKPQVADSGTAQRLLAQQLLTSGSLGAGMGILTGDPQMALATAGGAYALPKSIQMLLQSKTGQKYLSEGMGKKQKILADMLSGYGGQTGTAIGLGINQ